MAAKSSLGVVAKAEELMKEVMRGNDASHDAWNVLRMFEESLMFSGRSTAILHDIGDYKYLRDPSEEKLVENFLEQGFEESKKIKILSIIETMDTSFGVA